MKHGERASNLVFVDLKKASEEDLDAFYSFYCLGMDCYYDTKWESYYTVVNDEIVPKYCRAFGKKYIIEKIKRVLKKNGVFKRS